MALRISWLAFALLSVLLSLGGCLPMAGQGVDVRSVAARPPANVAALINVASEGEPLTLDASNFTLFEDEQELSPALTRQVLLDKASVVYHHTLLLVDNSLATDASVRDELISSISIFVERVRLTQPVSVYAYDGSERLMLVAEFSRTAKPRQVSPQSLKRLVPRDLSRNLNGAILLGGAELDRRLNRSGKAFGAGTLVVFAAGADLAGRTQQPEVSNWLYDTEHRVLSIGYGEQGRTVESFAKHGYYDAVAQETVSLAFEEAGHDVANEYARGYLLSYCSPARSGQRSLRIDVYAPGETRELLGGATTQFSAKGFRAGCDPLLLPRFERHETR